MFDINQRLCPAEVKLNTKNGPKRPPTLPNSIGFGFGVQLGSLARKSGVNHIMPYWFVWKWKWIYVSMFVRVLMCVFVYVSRLGLNSFPPPLTQSGSILGLQFHATYVPKMSYPYSHTEYNAPSRPKLASTSIHPQKIAFTVYLARTIFHPKLSPIVYT